MTPFQTTLLIIFSIIAYAIIFDENVSIYLTLVFKMMRLNIERFFWMVKYHPNNFITTWIQNLKYERIAKELQEEMERKGSELSNSSKVVE